MALAAALCLSFISCNKNSENSVSSANVQSNTVSDNANIQSDNSDEKIEVTLGESERFSRQELEAASVCVQQKSKEFKGSMTKLWYDEERANKAVNIYLQYGNGSQNGASYENTIVLFSDFSFADDSVGNPVGEQEDKSTPAYSWTLIRDDKNGEWRVDDSGVDDSEF